MKTGIAMLLVSLVALPAFGQQAVVAVVVMEKSVQRPTSKPFKSVGLFKVFRGGAKVAKASCPDLSNEDGKLSCTIPCTASDVLPGNFSIVPPDSGPRIRGYVPPASKDVQVIGCKVSPSTREFEYVDSLLALRDTIQSDSSLTQLASSTDGGKTIVFVPPAKAFPVFAELVRKPGGIAKVIALQKLTALASEKAESENDPQAREQFTQYSVGASNVLLNEIARANLGTASTSLKITGATADYYSNLKTLESGLETKMGRTPGENLLLNDVQALRQLPYKLSTQRQMSRHLGIRMAGP